MPSLEHVVKAFVGRRVRVWTRYIEYPTEGVLVMFSLESPWLLLVRTDDKKYSIYNWKEVVRLDCLDEIRI